MTYKSLGALAPRRRYGVSFVSAFGLAALLAPACGGGDGGGSNKPSTMLPGGVALVTRLASRVHGTLPANIEVYTRQVTVAWCVFFAAQLAVSALLLKFSTLSTWSLFVNLLSFPLVGLMFVLEYAYRIVRFPDFAHASLRQTVQSFTDDAAH